MNINTSYTTQEDFKTHGHEKCVPATDVFILLTDLALNDHLGTFAQLEFCTSVGAKYRGADVRLYIQVISKLKAQDLIDQHNFSGAGWICWNFKEKVERFSSLP